MAVKSVKASTAVVGPGAGMIISVVSRASPVALRFSSTVMIRVPSGGGRVAGISSKLLGNRACHGRDYGYVPFD